MRRHLIALAPTLAMAAAGVLGGGGMALAAAPLAPEVIAPGAVPTLPVIRSDPGSVVAASGDYGAAPMPDDAEAPVGAADAQVRVRPTMFFQKSHYDGDGYAPGSDDHAKAVQPATGVALDVPLN
jgi:hypothetical protein